MAFHVPEQYRVTKGRMASDASYGNVGAFEVPFNDNGKRCVLRVIASDKLGWEHVSVSYPDRTPSWDAMCWIKAFFWDDGDCVLQYHPRKADYVNVHAHCLHLWRPIGVEFPTPPAWMVGPLKT